MMLLVTTLALGVASLCGGLAVLAHTERVIAHTHLRAAQAGYAAEAAARLAVAAVSLAPESSQWPASGDVGGLTAGSRSMAVGPGEIVDLDARTLELNQAAARDWPLGADTPRWRLMGWGRLPIAPADAAPAAPRVAMWVADDVMDRDGAAGEDANGVIMIRAEAFAAGGAARAVTAHLKREAGRVRVLSWRPAS